MNSCSLKAVVATLIVLLTVQCWSQAQSIHSPEGILSRVTAALETGDARSLVELSTSQLEVNVGEGTSLYSRDQARFVLSSFFEDHPPAEFQTGEVSILMGYATVQGVLVLYDREQPLHFFLRLARTGEAWRLKEIRMISGATTNRPTPQPFMLQDRRQ
jgi:hypothetical protein